jgi:hypothetical protein
MWDGNERMNKKNTGISFTFKSNNINFNYKLRAQLVASAGCVKGIWVLFDYKLYFHGHVD